MAYIPVPIEAEPTDVAEDAFAYLEEQVPGWLPSPGNLEAWLVEALSQFASELRDLVALVPDAIFAYYGESILGLPPYEPVAATGVTTWTAIDTKGYIVDAGTLVAVTPTADVTSYAFAVGTTFQIPAGQTQASGIEIQAIEPGAAASGLTGEVEVIDPLDFVASVTLAAPTTGGSDVETIDAYLARLSDLLTLLSPRPILPQDFAVLVQRTIPEIARATAIDLYNPTTGETDCPRCVTVAVVGADGEPVPSEAKQAADDLLQSSREVNFLAFIIDPAYTTIDVDFVVTAYPGFDLADVEARAIDAVTSFLSPETWGVPPYGDTSGRSWINARTVRLLEVASVLNNVEGVNYVSSLTLNAAGQPPGTADVNLAGMAPLPRPGAITGDATATP